MWYFGRGVRRGLRWWVLAILARGPKNGVEIMDEMEGLTMGWWRPSPGSVYPLLEELAREGLVRRRDDGRYELTDKGRREAGWVWGGGVTPRSAEEVLNEISMWITYLEDLKKMGQGEVAGQAQKIRELADRLMKLAA